jgi:hypothetical protein
MPGHFCIKSALSTNNKRQRPQIIHILPKCLRHGGGLTILPQAGPKLLASSDLPASASQVAKATGMYHHTQQNLFFLALSSFRRQKYK